MERVSRLDLDGLSDDEVLTFMSRAAGHELDEPGRALAVAVHRVPPAIPSSLARSFATWPRAVPSCSARALGPAISHSSSSASPRASARWSVAASRSLDPDVGKVLSAASILGHEFDVDVLSEVAGIDADDVLDRLDEGCGGQPRARAGRRHVPLRTRARTLDAARGGLNHSTGAVPPQGGGDDRGSLRRAARRGRRLRWLTIGPRRPIPIRRRPSSGPGAPGTSRCARSRPTMPSAGSSADLKCSIPTIPT